jgi:hypothetical protein
VRDSELLECGEQSAVCSGGVVGLGAVWKARVSSSS